MNSSKLFKSTFLLMIIAFISRGIGFVRDILVADRFGANATTDIYFAAVGIPDTLFIIIGLGISTALLPILSEAKNKSNDDEMHKLANNIINIILIISAIVFIVANIFPNVVVDMFAGGFSVENKKILLGLIPITLVNIFFLALNASFATILQVHEDFIIPSILGLFFNIPILAYLIFTPEYTVLGLTVANVIGNLSRVLFQIPSLLKKGYRYNFYINLNDKRIMRMGIILLPVLISAGANQVNFIVDKNLASHLASGSFTALDYSQRLIFFINSIITTSLTSITYPVLANKIHSNSWGEFKVILKKGINYILLLLTPITMGIIVLNSEIVSIVYKRGMFAEESVRITAMAFLGYGIGIAFTGLRDLLNSTLFAMGLTKTTTINGVVGVIINVVLSIISYKYLGVFGIAISASIAMIVTSTLLLNSIKNKVDGFCVKGIIKSFIKILVATFIMGIVIAYVKYILDYNVLVEGLICTFVGLLTYLVVIMILKLEELNEFKEIILNKIGK